MATSSIELTKETFEPTIQKPGIVLIDFWAAWCGPCRAFAPIFEAAATKHPDITFAKVDTDAQQELAAAFQIQSIPTLAVFRDGILLFSQPGALPAAALEQVVQKIREVDMDDIRRQVAQLQTKSPA